MRKTLKIAEKLQVIEVVNYEKLEVPNQREDNSFFLSLS